MTLFGYRNPHRKPSNCPKHPLHSEPCSFCARDNERMRNALAEALKELAKKKDEEKAPSE